jgi:hypothetical protein
MLRASLRRKEGSSSFAFPALALQLASSPRTVSGYYQPSRFAGLDSGAASGVEIPAFAKIAEAWGSTV